MTRLFYPVLISITLAAGGILWYEQQGRDPLADLLALTTAQAQTAVTNVPANSPAWPQAVAQQATQSPYQHAPAPSRPAAWPGGTPAAVAPGPAPRDASVYATGGAGPTVPMMAQAPPSNTANAAPLFDGPTSAPRGSLPGHSLSMPPTGDTAAPAAMVDQHSAELHEIPNAQIIARVGSDIILAGDVYGQVDAMLAPYQGKMPAEVLEEQREKLVRQALQQMIATKLLAVDARRNLPDEVLKNIEKNLDEQFETTEVERLKKVLKVATRAEVDRQMRAQGTSLDRRRRLIGEEILASQWRRQMVKVDDEVAHEDMLAYYQENGRQFDRIGRVRWEQVSVRIAKYPSKAEAYRALAEAGNQMIDGRPLADVARAISDGSTASDGGLHDWTTQGSLSSEVLNEALFALPVGMLSPVLEDDRSFHIVRVVEREPAGRLPFTEAQPDIRKKLRDQRFDAEVERSLTALRDRTKVWTIFDGPDPGQ